MLWVGTIQRHAVTKLGELGWRQKQEMMITSAVQPWYQPGTVPPNNAHANFLQHDEGEGNARRHTDNYKTNEALRKVTTPAAYGYQTAPECPVGLQNEIGTRIGSRAYQTRLEFVPEEAGQTNDQAYNRMMPLYPTHPQDKAQETLAQVQAKGRVENRTQWPVSHSHIGQSSWSAAKGGGNQVSSFDASKLRDGGARQGMLPGFSADVAPLQHSATHPGHAGKQSTCTAAHQEHLPPQKNLPKSPAPIAPTWQAKVPETTGLFKTGASMFRGRCQENSHRAAMVRQQCESPSGNLPAQTGLPMSHVHENDASHVMELSSDHSDSEFSEPMKLSTRRPPAKKRGVQNVLKAKAKSGKATGKSSKGRKPQAKKKANAVIDFFGGIQH